MAERQRWNAHYASRVNTYKGEPHPFLREPLALLPRGRALELAMGDGHNAIFLAQHGFSVTGIDISAVAVERSLQLSQKAGVDIDGHCRDLHSTTLPADTYDVVACFYCLQRNLFPQVMNALKPGGMVIYETFTREQAQYGPPTHPEYLLQSNELLEAFRALRIRIYREHCGGSQSRCECRGREGFAALRLYQVASIFAFMTKIAVASGVSTC